MDMKNFSKMWNDSLKVLDNSYVSCIIIFILILLASTLFSNINSEIKRIFSNKIVRLIIVLLIVWVVPKNVTIAILLAVVYCSSIHGFRFEGFENEDEENRKEKKSMKDDKDMKDKKEMNKQSEKDKKDMKDKDMKESKSKKDMDMETFENEDEEVEEAFENEDEEEVQENFIPFMSNNDFEQQFESGMKGSSRSENCLSTDPNQFDLVGSACSAVATFDGELNAQGMNSVMGFNLNQSPSQTAQPI